MYTIQLLTNEEYDKLPYKYAKESFGCANPKTGTAYVRKTDIDEFDMGTIKHELDELVAKVSPHEEDGIRYKKARKWLSPVVTTIASIINPYLGMGSAALFGQHEAARDEKSWGQVGIDTAMAGISGALSSVARGGQTAGQAWKAGTAASAAKGGGWLGQTLTGAQHAAGLGGAAAGAAGATGLGSQAANAMTAPTTVNFAGKPFNIGTGVGGASGLGFTPAASTALTAAPKVAALGGGKAAGLGFGGIGTGMSAGGGGSTLGSGGLGSGGISPVSLKSPGLGEKLWGGIKDTGKNITDLFSAGGGAAKDILGGMLGGGQQDQGFDFGRMAAGAALPMLGDQMTETPKMDVSQSSIFQDLQGKIEKGNVVPLTEDQSFSIDEKYDEMTDERVDALKTRFKNLRPGSDYLNDSQFKSEVQAIEEEVGNQKALAKTQLQFDLSNDQLQNLAQLAQMEVYELATNAGIEVQEAQKFKEMLGNMGFQIFQSGMPQRNNYANLISNLFNQRG